MTKAILTTNTNLLRDGSDLGIFTYYLENEKDIELIVALSPSNVNGVGFKEGEIGFTYKDFNTVRFSLNTNGELIAVGEDSGLFSINADYELIYTH